MRTQADLQAILAKNLAYFMNREKCLYKNANALGKAVGMSANTIRNILNPKQRPVTDTKPKGFPTADTLLALCSKLDCEVWELLHPDIERSVREREMYKHIETDFAAKMAQKTHQSGAIFPGANRKQAA